MVSLQDIAEYFLNPLKEEVYTAPKTAVYAITLLAAVYGIFFLLKKLKVKINAELAAAISPYIVLGGLVRVMHDAGIVSSTVFVTPGIYLLIFAVVISMLLISLFVQRRFGIPYFKPMFAAGLVSLAAGLTQLNFINAEGAVLTSIFYLPWLAFFYKIKWSLQNKAVTLVQMLDATATYVAINFFAYSELHVVPALLINLFSPTAFLFAKVFVVVAVILAIDRFATKEFGSYLKLIVGILGAAPAARDILRLLALV